jgi:hypothetical protein
MQLLSKTAASFYFQQKTTGLNSELEREHGTAREGIDSILRAILWRLHQI